MAEIFLKAVNMSICATWMVLLVLIARVFLKKAPKRICVLLWALVGLRLICPFSFESALSLIPSSETVSPEIMMAPAPYIQTGVAMLDNAINPIISQTFAPSPGASANPLQILIPVAANLWFLGIVALVVYTAVSYLRLKHRLREATLYTENIYLSENIPAPFVFGFTKPVIYLPYNMTVSDMPHVIAHERAHIQRRDHWWKPLGFLMLSIHWFNPVMWLAYILFCRDIEMSCDETVVSSLSPEQRADYSTALLTCSTGRRRIAPCPLAFGETGIKVRIKAVLRYKKPALWVIIAAAALCVVIAVGCLTDPVFIPEPLPPENTVASYNGKYITKENLDRNRFNLEVNGVDAGTDLELINRIIKNEMFLEEAKRQGIVVTQEDIDAYMDSLERGYTIPEGKEMVDAYLQAMGMTLEEYYVQHRKQAPDIIARNRLTDSIMKQYCEKIGREFRKDKVSQDMIDARDAYIENLFTRNKYKIKYYIPVNQVEASICQSYWDTYVQADKYITAADLRIDCVYQSEAVYAVFVHDPRLGYSMALREETIGGVTLHFSDGQPLYIYSHGQIYSLREAYEREIIGTAYLRNLKTALTYFKRTFS